MPRPSASLSVRAGDAAVTVVAAVAAASAEGGVAPLAEGPSGQHRQEAAASGADTEETRPAGSLPTYQHIG